MSEEYTLKNLAQQPGIKNIYPVTARGKFIRALIAEHQAGHTTEEAEVLLNEAVQIIQEEQAKLLATT